MNACGGATRRCRRGSELFHRARDAYVHHRRELDKLIIDAVRKAWRSPPSAPGVAVLWFVIELSLREAFGHDCLERFNGTLPVALIAPIAGTLA